MERRKKRTEETARDTDTTITKRWCDLPEDVLRLIMSSLNLVDRIRLRTVCKQWQIPTRIGKISPIDEFPWAVNFGFAKYQGEVLSYCFLFDPHYKRHYISTRKINLRQAENIIFGGIVCASKYGWLLVSKKHNKTSSFMFYNPFSNEFITVPDLGFLFDVATFSLSPTSLNYSIFASHYVKDAWLAISVYYSGDNEWHTQIFSGRLNKRIFDVVYLDGVFYCICNFGWLGAFKVSDQRWSLLKNSIPIGMIKDEYKVYLLASDGHLLLAIMDHEVCKNVIKFDWCKMTWETAKAMGSQTLFLGPTSSSTSTVLEKIGNFPYTLNYCDYHLKHTFSDIEKDGNLQCWETFSDIEKDGNLRCWEIYGLEPSSTRLIWIEPQHI